MEQDLQSLTLPARLDATAARRLDADLRGRLGEPLQIDARAVEVISGLALEVLAAAALQWGRDGRAFGIRGASAAFTGACRTLALEGVLPVGGAGAARA